jgi:ATP-binding protein involved in chromosome partitioning
MTRRLRTYRDVEREGSADLPAQVAAQQERLERRLAAVGAVIAVGSGKGGVGKSLVSANLAAALALRGARVGALDADLNGPTLAAMLGAQRGPLEVRDDGVRPAAGAAGTRVISTDLLLAAPDAPLRWREPAEGGFIWQSTLETGVLREFLGDVAWGELDFLVVDMPPGTDRIVRLLALVRPAALLLVTAPSRAAAAVVARSITYARQAHVVRMALVANMEGIACERCGAALPLFAGPGGADLAARYNVPLWGSIPFDSRLATSTDAGRPLVVSTTDTPAAHAILSLADRVIDEVLPAALRRPL